jgi:two-component system response regulator DevR
LLTEARAVLPQIAGTVDVALVALPLPDQTGIEILRDLRAGNPHGQAIVLTADTEHLHHANAIKAGAAGVVRKSARPSEIADATRRVDAGKSVQPAQETIALVGLASQVHERTRDVQATLAQVTPREWQVLALLAEGRDNYAIAEQHFISPDTTWAHAVKMPAKLQVESRPAGRDSCQLHGIGPPR